MPRLDKTGPKGQGALTGRKTGNCTNEAGTKSKGLFNRRGLGYTMENETSRNRPGGGRGLGRGLGRLLGKGKRG